MYDVIVEVARGDDLPYSNEEKMQNVRSIIDKQMDSGVHIK